MQINSLKNSKTVNKGVGELNRKKYVNKGGGSEIQRREDNISPPRDLNNYQLVSDPYSSHISPNRIFKYSPKPNMPLKSN